MILLLQIAFLSIFLSGSIRQNGIRDIVSLTLDMTLSVLYLLAKMWLFDKITRNRINSIAFAIRFEVISHVFFHYGVLGGIQTFLSIVFFFHNFIPAPLRELAQQVSILYGNPHNVITRELRWWGIEIVKGFSRLVIFISQNQTPNSLEEMADWVIGDESPRGLIDTDIAFWPYKLVMLFTMISGAISFSMLIRNMHYKVFRLMDNIIMLIKKVFQQPLRPVL